MASRFSDLQEKHSGLSAGALLLLAEIRELSDLKKLKRFPVRAVLLLGDSIGVRANNLIQAGCSV